MNNDLKTLEQASLTPEDRLQDSLGVLQLAIFSADVAKNIENIYLLEPILKQMEKIVAEAKIYNAPPAFGEFEAGDYILTHKEGAVKTPLATSKVVDAIRQIDPSLVSEFAIGLTVTKTYLSSFCKANDISIRATDVLSDEKQEPSKATVSIRKRPKLVPVNAGEL
jgi:hypothetical protein